MKKRRRTTGKFKKIKLQKMGADEPSFHIDAGELV